MGYRQVKVVRIVTGIYIKISMSDRMSDLMTCSTPES